MLTEFLSYTVDPMGFFLVFGSILRSEFLMFEVAYLGGALISRSWKVIPRLDSFVTFIVVIMGGFFYVWTYPHFSQWSIVLGIVLGAIV